MHVLCVCFVSVFWLEFLVRLMGYGFVDENNSIIRSQQRNPQQHSERSDEQRLLNSLLKGATLGCGVQNIFTKSASDIHGTPFETMKTHV